jgi:hypothetical protein
LVQAAVVVVQPQSELTGLAQAVLAVLVRQLIHLGV